MGEKKIALVTGANKGIGFETCRQLGKRGNTVILMGARDKEKGEIACKKLMDEGLEVKFVQLDVTITDQIGNVKKIIENSYGKLDILINNAGIAHKDEPLFTCSVETISMQTIRETFEVNFYGVIELTQMLLPLIKKSPAGRIVNMSSMLGSLTLHSGNPDLDQIKPFAYDASKTALNQFTVHLAAALKGTSVKVNSAHPGWVKTDLGTDQAPMEVVDGAKTGVALATLGEEGPTGKFIHLGEEFPW